MEQRVYAMPEANVWRRATGAVKATLGAVGLVFILGSCAHEPSCAVNGIRQVDTRTEDLATAKTHVPGLESAPQCGQTIDKMINSQESGPDGKPTVYNLPAAVSAG